MPIYSYKCSKCHGEFEEIRTLMSSNTSRCLFCGGVAKKQITVSMVNVHRQDAGWIREASLAADPNGGVADRIFRADPTRENYESWKMARGLRHLEEGEKATTERKSADELAEQLCRQSMARNSITIQTGGE